MFKKILSSMPSLAEYVSNHKCSNEIKAVIGITMLHKGAEKLGFENFKPYNKLYRVYKKISQLPIYLLSTENPSISNSPSTSYLLISKEKLLDLYKRNK
jgi:hypothetical protein